MTGARNAKRVLLGHIAGAHGLRGEVLIKSYAGVAEHIAAYGPLTDESGARAFTITVLRVMAKGVVAHLTGVTDRTDAEALQGQRLYVERDQLPETSTNEFYHADLIGLSAVSPVGKTVGQVVALRNFGAGDLLEIRLVSSGGTALVPFTKASVPKVDIAGGHVVIAMPAASAHTSHPSARTRPSS